MLRPSGALLRRISYVTDVEGDFAYFQRFVCISRVLRWEDSRSLIAAVNALPTSSHPVNNSLQAESASCAALWAPLQSPFVPRHTRPESTTTVSSPISRADNGAETDQSRLAGLQAAVTAVAAGTSCLLSPQDHVAVVSSTERPAVCATVDPRDASYDHLVDISRFRLTFRDSTSHFVFGGDAFDHGADLTFGRVLLDFKRRFPTRVHLLLGNRDVNKMVLSPRMAPSVTGMAADAAEQRCFSLPPLSRDVVAAAAMTKQLSYKDYLRQQQQQQSRAHHDGTAAASPSKAGSSNQLLADPVTFLQWALKHKMGCPNTFEHRRQELQELHRLREAIASTPAADVVATAVGAGHHQGCPSCRRVVCDEEVAESFFAAAQPGGVYHEYLRLGELTVMLDGVLFVHGGVNGSNAGFVPSLEATSYAEQLTAGEWWLPEVQPTPATAETESSPPPRSLSTPNASAAAAASAPSSSSATVPKSKRHSALEWLAALSSFKSAAFEEWANSTGLCGEALRAYVYPRIIAPHSVAVGTVMHTDGPHHISLPAAAYLIESGIHTVCGGHQPIGDTPAVVRQPGGFAIVDADTSYCGRSSEFCTSYNRRGAAVMEVVIDSGEGSTTDGPAPSTKTTNAHGEAAAAAESPVAHSFVAHGFRADGTAFEFDLYDDLRVGRYVGDGWWVRLPPCVAPKKKGGDDGLYELHRTHDGFRHEDVRWATGAEVDAMLQAAAASGQAMVEGELAPRYTKAELEEVRARRLKTKVTRASLPHSSTPARLR
jgi:hypothetical protein